MSKVWSCNEWDPLEEVIIGTATNARYPILRSLISRNTEHSPKLIKDSILLNLRNR